MSKSSEQKSFVWTDWNTGKLPELEYHSEKKLELLFDYLVLYLQIVLKNAPGKELQEITLIDGFAGGGSYDGGKTGSPLTILKAVKAAEALINQGREKPTRIVPTCYFIEQDPDAFACLQACLDIHGYGPEIGKSIHLRPRSFRDCVPEIIHDINERHKRGGNRTIFFLDQCGYTEIEAGLIKTIDQQLGGRAEFIVNFAITWFQEFFSEKTVAAVNTSLAKIGIEEFVDVPAMLEERTKLGGSWKHAVEAYIGQGFHNATEIQFFSPFYIEPLNNHRGYWLLHLAQSSRARSAMTQIHWSKANRSRHYGPKGYGILSFKPDLRPEDYIEGMEFDELNRKACSERLVVDYAELLRSQYPDGITYGKLADITANNTIADFAMLRDAIWTLFQNKDFEVKSPSGRDKRTQNFQPNDVIRPRQQMIFTNFGANLPPPRSAKFQ